MIRPGAAALVAAVAVTAAAAEWRLETLSSQPSPGSAPEIVRALAAGDRLIATDSLRNEVGLYRLLPGPPPRIELLDQDPARAGPQGVAFPTTPTSIAVHPTLPVAFVVLLGRADHEPGTLVGRAITDAGLGAEVFRAATGFHPDAVTVSPDGRWVLVADEGEGADDTPGSISLYDLNGWSPGATGAVAVTQLGSLGAWCDAPDGRVEPEYVAVDPESRIAAASCQENDRVLLIDLRAAPRITGAIRLSPGAQPDGVAVARWQGACLVAVAEEGESKKAGQAVSVWRVDEGAPRQLWRQDVRPLLDPSKPNKDSQPESVLWCERDGRLGLVVGVERRSCVMLFDLTDPERGRFIGKADVGERPEGVAIVPRGGEDWIVTANEGKKEPGGFSIVRWAH